MPVTVKSLNLIHSRQFLRNKTKSRMYGELISVVYLWIIEIVVFFILKKEDTEIPAAVPAILAIIALIPDFIFKLIFLHDESVMDSFLKTRPVSRKVWNRFLSLYQFRKLSNLLMPLILLPICLLFGPPLPGLATFVLAYLASVTGGIIVMHIKHKSDYQERNIAGIRNTVRSAKGNHIFGTDARAFLRSKRLRGSAIYFFIFIYFQCLTYSFQERYNFYWLFLFTSMMASWIPLNGFAVEANFFNGIWSRPISVRKLLYSKYIYGLLCGAAGLLLCLPMCLWSRYNVLDVVSISLYSACFVNLGLFTNAFNCVPYDLFGKVFYNQQGRSSHFNWSLLLALLLPFGIGVAAIHLLPGWKSQVFFTILGITGLCIVRPYFRWIESKFMAKRYDYMEKYNSK